MIEPIDDIAKDAIDFLQDQQNHRLDLKPKLFNFAIDSICRVFFGILTKCHRNENQDIIDLANKVLDQYKMKTYFDDLKYHCPGIFLLNTGTKHPRCLPTWPKTSLTNALTKLVISLIN